MVMNNTEIEFDHWPVVCYVSLSKGDVASVSFSLNKGVWPLCLSINMNEVWPLCK